MDHIRRTHRLLPASVYAATRSDLQRFCELLQAFVHLAVERPDLHLRGAAAPPPLGFAVRLQPDPWSPGVEISLSLDSVRLTSWSQHGGVMSGATERRLGLDLSAGFRWECLVFPDAEQLARTLLHRMEDELSRS